MTSRSKRKPSGFTLIVVISLMVLLALLAVGLLGLSAVTLRTQARTDAINDARSNARLALDLAIGQLQKELGPDQRISAPAAILDSNPGTPDIDGLARAGEMVGVWEGWSPAIGQGNGISSAGPDYDQQKTSAFRTWLASSTDQNSLETNDWPRSAAQGKTITLFREDTDGFDMNAEVVPAGDGAVAWGTLQENTKARILPGGYHGGPWNGNDAVLAPGRTGFDLSASLEAADGTDAPALVAKLVSTSEIPLSPVSSSSYAPTDITPNYSVHSRGVLADVVKGGLRTDLTTAFELSDNRFRASEWGDRDNPFVDGSDNRFDGERPLFEPGPGFAPEISISDKYGSATTEHYFKMGHLPTFTTLRSHYRKWRHLYDTELGPTAWNRPMTGAGWADAGESVAGVEPVLDRVLLFLQASVDRGGRVYLIVTPIVTLWNPYGIAIDCEGFNVYPWLDFPVNITWTGEGGTGDKPSQQVWVSNHLSSGDTGEGRTRLPYFVLRLTSDGTDATTQPMRFAAGEVKVFSLAKPDLIVFDRTAAESARTCGMKPVTGYTDLITEGGFRVPMDQSEKPEEAFTYKLKRGARLKAQLEYSKNQHKYYVVMEDLGRTLGREPNVIANVQVTSGGAAETLPSTPWMSYEELVPEPIPLAVFESFHRTVRDGISGNRLSDIAYTNNPLQPYATSLLTGNLTRFTSAPHYNANLSSITDIVGSGLELSLDGRRSFYGESNSVATGRDYLVFSEIPRSPLVSLGSLQHADLSNSVYAPMLQFGNSWAPPYVQLNHAHGLIRSAKPRGVDFYDFSYLTNESLWDSYFFSGLAPEFRTGSGGGPNAWNNTQVNITRSSSDVAKDFFENPGEAYGRVARFRPWNGERSSREVADRVTGDEAALLMAAHLMVDGSFNVNSTSVEAWTAMLASTRGLEFDTSSPDGADSGAGDNDRSPIPRLHHPLGSDGDPWLGFRSLSDSEIRDLAENIVEQIKRRGPFQSIAEFVNRRLEDSDLGKQGALQAAIDTSGLNEGYRYENFDPGDYRFGTNLPTTSTGAGTPGYLTQADLLQPLASTVSVRSDTFVIRAMGEARDDAGNVLARAVCEAVVQRFPELVDPSQDAATDPDEWNDVNRTFGRRFRVVSFRWLTKDELS